jgi:hypothetical protein
LVSNDRYYCSSVGVLGITFLILKGHHLEFCKKNFLPPLEPKLLLMWKIIGKALKMVCGAYQFAETWY